MRNKLQHSWRSPIIFILFVAMMAALFVSRVALSASLVAFIAVSFFHREYKKQFSSFISSPLLWGMSLLFVVPLVTGIWSEEKQEWLDMLRIKLPLLFLPLAFAGPVGLSKKQWEWLAAIFIIIITAGSCWTIFQYAPDARGVNESYLRAKSIITPLENDHVRFSWLVSIAILLAGWFCIAKRKESKTVSWLLAMIVIWLIVFLHILAARTGLFSFYIMVGGVAVSLIIKKNKPVTTSWKYGLLLITVLVALPLIAYKTIPTFHNRVQYFLYDKSYFEKANYLPGSTDAVRVISLKAGWSLLNESPLKGTGFGDILSKAKQWYSKNYPDMIETDKIYPGSEWLIYGTGAGWPGFLLFSIVMLIPFFISTNNKLLWWLLNGTAAFSFLFDIGLEVQFGVFIYAFIILWWYRWMKEEKA